MPKAPSAGPSSSRPSLRRNQACRSCRKRKLKCDASRPHCGTCVKQWQALISVPAPVGYAHPTEPQCSYDPVEGLTLAPETDPMDRIKQLEDQITQLKGRLYERDDALSRSMSPGRQTSNNHPYLRPGSAASSGAGRHTPDVSTGGIALPNNYNSGSPESRLRLSTRSPEVTTNSAKETEPFMDLLFSGWNPDLPDPAVLDHYIDVFFRCDPCGSRVLHRPSFMASMLLPPRDSGFPHSAILHAICASASRWSPQDVITLPDGTRRDQFAEYHAGKTRQYIDKTMATGEEIFSVMQACIILSWYFYQEGRWVEVWIFAGFQTRVAVPLRLNYPGTFSTNGNNSPGAYLAPPKDHRDLESRRRTWWMTIVFDRIASVGGWIHAVDERDLGTELPLRNEDFESEQFVPSNPQDLASADVFTRHPPQYTDPFLLSIKAVMLFGKVTDFNVRGSLRSASAPSKNQNPFFLPGFEELDKLVSSDFLESLPHIYKNNYGVSDQPTGSALDTDLYMVHVIPHAATITLHNPYLDFTDSQCVSTARCVNSARSILAAYYMLSATSLDITRLHPFAVICWYLAAVVQVQLCKYFIEIGDNERESTVWGEINVLRFAMLEYGNRSPIGTRQERLLQGLMREIVRMTAQKQPLDMGVPLYPFSHAGVFGKGARIQVPEGESTPPAPLPHSAPYGSTADSSSMTASHRSPAISMPPPTTTPRPVSSTGSWAPPKEMSTSSPLMASRSADGRLIP
ncbi:hypothetical protein HWV62_40230 [Athelia sp. TMB]|nr:hypothetical protein HWV62_40230 [Athelia sp. TMB]